MTVFKKKEIKQDTTKTGDSLNKEIFVINTKTPVEIFYKIFQVKISNVINIRNYTEK